MGPCASGSSNRSRNQLPLTFSPHLAKNTPIKTTQNEFIFKLSNVCLVPVFSKNITLKFIIDDLPPLKLDKTTLKTQIYSNPQLPSDIERYQLQWNQQQIAQFVFNDLQLAQKTLSIIMSDGRQEKQIVRISLYLLVHGPYHHNIQIPFNDSVFRILFDAKISHIIEANLKVKQVKINTLEKVNFFSCHFTVKAMHQDEVLARSKPSYPLRSDLNPTLFEDQELERGEHTSRVKLHRTISIDESININELEWRQRQSTRVKLQLPSIVFDISTTQITKYFIYLTLWSSDQQDTLSYIGEARFPLWKMFDKQFAQQNLRMTGISNNTQDENQKRQVCLNQKLYKHQDLFGNCDISITFVTEKMIEQSKYCSRTEEGIVNMRPTHISKNIKSNSKTIGQLWKMSEEIDQLLHQASQKKTFERVESQILDILTKICNKLAVSPTEVLYTDANQNEQLMNNQKILINLLQKMFPFIQNTQNPFVSQDCWLIIINILKRTEFALQNLGLKGNNKSNVLQKKKEVAVKYQQTLFKLIEFALKGYGLYHNDNSRLSAFLSFVFFRVPLFRNYFLEVIEYNNRYQKMQKTLSQFQSQIEPKTSFSNNFAEIKGNWNSHFFDELKSDKKSSMLSQQLQQNFRSKRWFMQMSYRDQNLYDFISMLFESLSNDSAQRADKWKYIQGYSQIVAVVLTQLESRPIDKYTLGLIRSSIQLLQNEHLISPLLPILCDRVNVYDSQKVTILLQILDEYLDMITKKKTTQLPTTFNHNYFFKIIKTILDGDHYQTMSRLLLILYNYFDFFNQMAKYQTAMFLMGKVFFKLYYHWWKNIRNTFFMFLEIKIKHIRHQKSTDIKNQYNKVTNLVKIIDKIHEEKNKQFPQEKELYKKLKNKMYHRFKSGNSLCSSRSKGQYALESLIKRLDDDIILNNQSEIINHSLVEMRTPEKYRHSLQTTQILPDKKHSQSHTNLPNQPAFSRSTLYSVFQVPQSQQPRKELQVLSVRKKRRPSIHIEVASPQTKYKSRITNSLHDLSQLSENQIKHIRVARNQMKQVQEKIQSYLDTHNGQLPKNQMLEIKENQVKA